MEENLEYLFDNNITREQTLKHIIDSLNQSICLFSAEIVDENFEYFKENLNNLNYSIKKVGQEKITNVGKYLITKQ